MTEKKLCEFFIKYILYIKKINDIQNDKNKIISNRCRNCQKTYYPRKTSTKLYCSGECKFTFNFRLKSNLL
jgi:hypothetical protein